MNLRNDKSLLVILPTLNEALSISETVRSIRNEVPNCDILVVDNGSTDDTVKIASEMGLRVAHEPNRGKGYAIRRGLSHVENRHQAIFMVDADDTYSLTEIRNALNLVLEQGYDMVVGNRVVRDKNNTRSPEFKRGHRIGNLSFTVLGNLIHTVGIKDSLSGWRMMSKGFARSFPGGATGFEIEAELNGHADLLKCAIANLDVAYRGRVNGSSSKLRTYKDGFKILRRNIQIFKNDQPFKAFTILWFPTLLLSIYLTQRAVGGYLRTGLVEQLPSLIAGVTGLTIAGLLWVTGMNLERSKQIRSILARYEYNRYKSN
jgi:glycosyltransferase involved in cell wall biosynthesis